jgi:hypothetical protein
METEVFVPYGEPEPDPDGGDMLALDRCKHCEEVRLNRDDDEPIE